MADETIIFPMGDDTGKLIVSELAKQNGILAKMANTTAKGALLEDWSEVASLVRSGLAPTFLPVETHTNVKYVDSRPDNSTEYDARWNFVHHGMGSLDDGETIPVAMIQMHHCLPFDTPFSPAQAFLKAVTVIPAGTYNIKMGFSWGTNVKANKYYQFTLTHDLPAGGQLAGFTGAPDQNPANWRVYAFASDTATAATETCVVTEGSGGTNLGTFTDAGEVVVPASGTPATVKTVGSIKFYGLNSLHRVAYGNNRWLHSPLRQFLNSVGTGWWHPKTVFDRPPAYATYEGFLSGLPEDFVEAMQPIAQVSAISYLCDGGTSGAPEYDTTYDKVFLPSGKQHNLQPNAAYGGAAGLEGDAWEYWQRVAGSSTPLPWSTSGNQATYHPEYVQYDLAAQTTARSCWMRSAYRGSGNYVAYVTATGLCSSHYASYGYRAAAACAIG